MGKYKVLVTKSAEKALFKVPQKILPKILAALTGLGFDPYPAGAKKLTGYQSVFRLRVQQYRIIYEILGKEIIVKILKIGHRKDVYRGW